MFLTFHAMSPFSIEDLTIALASTVSNIILPRLTVARGEIFQLICTFYNSLESFFNLKIQLLVYQRCCDMLKWVVSTCSAISVV